MSQPCAVSMGSEQIALCLEHIINGSKPTTSDVMMGLFLFLSAYCAAGRAKPQEIASNLDIMSNDFRLWDN
jgi:hypothetical protein